jgi:hypothetical protein
MELICCFILNILLNSFIQSYAYTLFNFYLIFCRYGHDEKGTTTINLGMASTNDPTTNTNWTRFGPVSYSQSKKKKKNDESLISKGIPRTSLL